MAASKLAWCYYRALNEKARAFVDESFYLFFFLLLFVGRHPPTVIMMVLLMVVLCNGCNQFNIYKYNLCAWHAVYMQVEAQT